jgi:hypothetical protein
VSLRPPPDTERLRTERDGWIRLAIVVGLVAVLVTSVLTPYGIVQSNRHHSQTDAKTTRILHSIRLGQDQTHSQLQQVANATACLTHPVAGEPCTTAITETAVAPSPVVVTNTVQVPVYIPSPYPVPTIIRSTVAPSPAARPGVVTPSPSPTCLLAALGLPIKCS